MSVKLEILPQPPIEALAFQHRRDLAKAHAEIATLRKQLLDHGIEPITKAGEEWLALFQQACHVMRTAQLALHDLGTSKEMLEEWSANCSDDSDHHWHERKRNTGEVGGKITEEHRTRHVDVASTQPQ